MCVRFFFFPFSFSIRFGIFYFYFVHVLILGTSSTHQSVHTYLLLLPTLFLSSGVDDES